MDHSLDIFSGKVSFVLLSFFSDANISNIADDLCVTGRSYNETLGSDKVSNVLYYPSGIQGTDDSSNRITAVQAVTCSHPNILERAASGNGSGRCVLWAPADLWVVLCIILFPIYLSYTCTYYHLDCVRYLSAFFAFFHSLATFHREQEEMSLHVSFYPADPTKCKKVKIS